MKYHLFILAATLYCLAVPAASGQPYVRIGGGYGFNLASQNQGVSRTADKNNVGGSTTELLEGSYGRGIRGTAAIGYAFTNNIALQLDAGYFSGTTMTTGHIWSSPTLEATTEAYGRGLFLTPSLVISVNPGKLIPYAKFGLIAGFPRVFSNSSSTSDGVNGTGLDKSERIEEYSGGMAFGLHTGAGLSIPVGSAISFFTEAAFDNMSYQPSLREVTKYEINGAGVEIPPGEKRIELVTSRNMNDKNALTRNFAFSSFSLSAGMRIEL